MALERVYRKKKNKDCIIQSEILESTSQDA